MTAATGLRSVSFPSGDRTLEGLLHLPREGRAAAPAAGVAVCHPHPLYGGDMHNNVVVALCRALAERGVVALRFNFRGVGASGGVHSRGSGERSDALAALDYLRSLPEVDSSRIALAGYSFGAIIALLAGQGVRAVAAVSPPAAHVRLSEINVTCPVLMAVGDRDDIAPADAVARLAASLGPSAEHAVVSGADHFWAGSEDRLAPLVCDFLARHLSPSAPSP